LQAGLASLHLIFFSPQQIQALPRTGTDGSDASTRGAFFFDLLGDVGNLALDFLIDAFRAVVGEATAPTFLLFLFGDEFGASGDVDMSRSGSLTSFSASVSFFLLRFLLCGFFSSVASVVAATPLSVVRAGRLSDISHDVLEGVPYEISSRSYDCEYNIPVVILAGSVYRIMLVHGI
jgi:hypothetical protein